MNVLTFDYHGAWEPKTGFNAALNHRTGESELDIARNVDYAIQRCIGAGKTLITLIVNTNCAHV